MAENYIIIMIDGFGFALFSAALYYGTINYRKTETSKVLWALFNITMLMGVLMSLSVGLEWMEFFPHAMDQIEEALTFAFTAMLFAFALAEKEEVRIKQ